MKVKEYILLAEIISHAMSSKEKELLKEVVKYTSIIFLFNFHIVVQQLKMTQAILIKKK